MPKGLGWVVDQTLSDDLEDPMAQMYIAMNPSANLTEVKRYLASDPRDDSDTVAIRPTVEQAFVFPTRADAAEAVALLVRLELEKFGAHVTWRIEEQQAVAKVA